jgi:hypothetical protein
MFISGLAGVLVSSGASRADVAVARDINDYLMKAIQPCWATRHRTQRAGLRQSG